MLLTCLVSLLTATTPDAGLLPLTRTHAVKWLPTPGQPVRARLDIETFTVGGEWPSEHVIEVLTLTLPDGGTTPGLDQLNAVLHQDYRDDYHEPVPSPASLQDGTAPYYAALASQYASGQFGGIQGIAVTVPFFEGVFLQARSCADSIGAYPSLNCGDLLLRTDTGATWTWLEAVPRAKQAAFLEACTKRLAPASLAARADYTKSWTPAQREANSELLEKNFPERCDPRQLRRAAVQPNGDLVVDVGLSTHADPFAAWAFTLPRAFLSEWVDPQGPLGHLVAKR